MAVRALFHYLLMMVFAGICYCKIPSNNVTAYARLMRGTEWEGDVTFTELPNGKTNIYGSVSGLRRGWYGVHIHTNNDISNNCSNVGPHYDPQPVMNETMMLLLETLGLYEPHNVNIGKIGNIFSKNNYASINFWKENVPLKGHLSVIGRTFGVDNRKDLYDNGTYKTIICGLIYLIDV